MAMTLSKATKEAQSAHENVNERIRAVNRRRVEYALMQRDCYRPQTDYLYTLVGDCLAFLGKHGECDEAMRLIQSVMAYEEALANIACATTEPTDLEQMHEDADEIPDYLR